MSGSSTWHHDERLQAALAKLPLSMSHCAPPLKGPHREAYRSSWWRHGEARPGPVPGLRLLPRPDSSSPGSGQAPSLRWASAQVLRSDKNLQCTRAPTTPPSAPCTADLHELWSLRMHLDGRRQRSTLQRPRPASKPSPSPPASPRRHRAPAHRSAARWRADPGWSVGRPRERRQLSPAPPGARRSARDAWLNLPEWTERIPEVIPLGTDKSPYPDRIVARPASREGRDKRTLTTLQPAPRLVSRRRTRCSMRPSPPPWVERLHERHARRRDPAQAAGFESGAGRGVVPITRP